MYDTEGLAAAVRQAAANLNSAAAAVGRVMESVAQALEREAGKQSAAKPSSPKRRKTAPSVRTATKKSTGPRAGRTARGRRSSA